MKKFFIRFIILALLVTVGVFLFMLYKDTGAPIVTITPDKGLISAKAEFVLEAQDTASGLKRLVVQVVQGGQSYDLIKKEYPPGAGSVQEKFRLNQAGLQDGDFALEIAVTDASYARFGRGNTAELTAVYELDTTPPTISIKGGTVKITRGGTAAFAYNLTETAASTGVLVKNYYFPAYQRTKGDWVCFMAFPHTMTMAEFKPIIGAMDPAGNVKRQELACRKIPRTFKEDTINLSDSFLDRKMPEFEADVPGEMTTLQRFLVVNRDLRVLARNKLIALGRKSEAHFLWSGTFTRLPKAATMAQFADHREYIYKEGVVDEQIHTGIDLASVRNAPVPAANGGRVIFAGTLTIYGQAVIIDHGFGLQTLYSHLSEFTVGQGEMVEKGQAIGKTGATGMAGGDHLHFEVLVSGIPVAPRQWWDAGWIQQNIINRLNQ